MTVRVYLNAKEAAEMLGISEPHLYTHVKRGNIAKPVKRKRKGITNGPKRLNHWHRDDVVAFKNGGFLQKYPKLEAETVKKAPDDDHWRYIMFLFGVICGIAAVSLMVFFA
jgi:hypothetical protein